MQSSRLSLLRAGLLLAVVSCSDGLAPTALRPRDASRDVEITVGTAAIDMLFNGTSVGMNAQGDHCFTLSIDGATGNTPSLCSPFDVPNIAPGVHTFVLKQPAFGGPLPVSPLEDASPTITATIVGGQRTPVAFELSGSRGMVTGALTVNGAAPAPGQYMACVTNYGCSTLPGTAGAFNLLARPQSTSGYISSMMSPGVHLLDFTFNVAAGQTVNVGTMNLQFGTAAIDILFNGQSLGMNGQGDHCFTLSIDGATGNTPSLCSPFDVSNIAPGVHTFVLKQPAFGGPLPISPLEDASPTLTATIVGGQRTAVALDVSQSRGMVTGALTVNGAAPPAGQYMACVTNYGCSTLPGAAGAFNLLVRPQSTSGYISSMSNPGTHLLDFTFNVAAGQTVNVGTMNLQFGTAAIDILFNGQSIGMTGQGDHCFTLSIDGATGNTTSLCSPFDVPNIAPGVHTFVLKQPAFGGPLPISPLEDASPTITATIVGGQRTAVALDVSQSRGMVTGVLKVNGAAPAPGQYMACVTNYGCSSVFATTGAFSLLVRPQSTSGYISSMMSPGVHLADFTFIVAAGQTTVIGGISTAQPGSTPAGANVTVNPVNQGSTSTNSMVTLTFSNVTTGGITSVVQSTQGPPPPTGIRFGSPPVYFDITTTAVYSGPITICLNYTGSTFQNTNNLKLMHRESSGQWVDVTTSRDLVNRIICGSVTSLSPFIVGETDAAAALPPTISYDVSGPAGDGGWYTGDVAVTWTVNDQGSPLTSSSGCSITNVRDNTAGLDLTCTAANAGGSATKTVTIKRDANHPLVTANITGTLGDNNWYIGTASVSWSVTGLGPSSATSSCVVSQVSTDTPGQSFSCSARSGAGLTGSSSVTIKRDATKPLVSIVGNAGTYTVDQTVSITCDISDAMSGIATQSCNGASGAAYSLGAGAHTVTASATDKAGNAQAVSDTYTVAVTTTGVCNLVRRWVSQAGVANSMCGKLANAQAAKDRGSANAASNILDAFVSEVQAQAGKAISAENAAILITLAHAMQ